MNWRNTNTHYGSAAIALHWLMLALLVAVYALIELRVFYPSGSVPREAMKAWHFMLGLTIFLLLWIRVAVRLAQALPSITPALPRWQHRFSTAVHYLLYAFMAIMPVLGWLLLSTEGDAIPWFGLTLPALTSADPALAERVKEVHQTLGKFGYMLIGLHAAAALLHHYFMRDDTLLRMLPTRVKRD